MISGIELRHLRYLVAVADAGHVGRAAQSLHVSQPSVSTQLKQLEQRVGAKLVEPVGRGIGLTAAGQEFANDARRLLEQLSTNVTAAREVHQGARGRLRLGFASTAVYGGFPDRLRTFKQAHPHIMIELLECTWRDQVSMLFRGELDAALAIEPSHSQGLQSIPLWSEPVFSCIPADHPLARSAEVGASDLKHEKLVGFPRDMAPGLYDAFGRVAFAGGFSLHFEQTAVQMQTIVGLVAAGFGCALVPECMQRLNRTDVAYLPINDSSVTLGTQLLLPENASATAREFAEVAAGLKWR